MTLRLRLLPFVFAVAILPTHAHDTDSQSGTLGKVSFPTTCNPKVQAQFERAVAMLHSFWYSAGERAFRDVLKDDPSCAIADWGIAAIQMSNPLAGQGASPKGAEIAQQAIDEARRIGLKTERERDYVDAVAAYYQDFGTRSERERQVARAQAYEALAKKYPVDDEAQIFAALYVAGTQTQSDQTHAAYLKAAAVLEDQFKKHPDHPGVAHYLIHSYDAPPIAAKGLTAARRYASIAPAAPHALHMGSHIFTRTGDWAESAATNKRSRDVAIAGNEPDEAYHASDYMVYAYLQLARDDEARRSIDAAMKVEGASPRFVAPYAVASMPARYVFEGATPNVRDRAIDPRHEDQKHDEQDRRCDGEPNLPEWVSIEVVLNRLRPHRANHVDREGRKLVEPRQEVHSGRNDGDENVQHQRAQELDKPQHAMEPDFRWSLVDGFDVREAPLDVDPASIADRRGA